MAISRRVRQANRKRFIRQRELHELQELYARYDRESKLRIELNAKFVIGTKRTQMQIDLEQRSDAHYATRNGKIVKRVQYSTSKKFNGSEIDIDKSGDYTINGKFVPTTQIVKPMFGAARIRTEIELDQTATSLKRQTYSHRTKQTHLNAHGRCRGQIKISGGLVNNEMTTAVHDAIEMDMDSL